MNEAIGMMGTRPTINPAAKQLTGASVIIYKDNKIFLQQRADNKGWAYHGGRIEIGERVEDAARRELLEETGLTANTLTLFGVFSGTELHNIYPDGNEFYIIDIVFTCNDFEGTVKRQEEECLDLRWFDMDKLPENLSPPTSGVLKKFVERYRLLEKTVATWEEIEVIRCN